MKKTVDYSKQGKKNRASGMVFETKVRNELENMGWIVSKWMNTIDYERDNKIGKIVPAKRKYNPFLKTMVIGTGFPDFICFKKAKEKTGNFFIDASQSSTKENYEVIAVEAKKNGYLNQIEKGMCHWLLENNIFPRILIAKKGKKRGEIEYIDFKEKYGIK